MPMKPKLNKEMVEAILTYKENGLSDKDVCDMVGISQQSFYEWLKEAETGINAKNPARPVTNYELKVELAEGRKKAEAAFKAYHIQNITKAAKKTWQASAWILERMYPKEFGRIDRQYALTGEATKENGMLDEILDYMRLTGGADGVAADADDVHADK